MSSTMPVVLPDLFSEARAVALTDLRVVDIDGTDSRITWQLFRLSSREPRLFRVGISRPGHQRALEIQPYRPSLHDIWWSIPRDTSALSRLLVRGEGNLILLGWLHHPSGRPDVVTVYNTGTNTVLAEWVLRAQRVLDSPLLSVSDLAFLGPDSAILCGLDGHRHPIIRLVSWGGGEMDHVHLNALLPPPLSNSRFEPPRLERGHSPEELRLELKFFIAVDLSGEETVSHEARLVLTFSAQQLHILLHKDTWRGGTFFIAPGSIAFRDYVLNVEQDVHITGRGPFLLPEMTNYIKSLQSGI
ncbi:hypothetical protein SISNIDRAFT_548556 [Sistotremastrum niveocremeum HHB9708]|uniref:Uncharacterized protein n=1 Tax=Sistotremastrum niveocremeum HHB9708 TaxID=1314777 RepID=A0A164WM08_9AGAM|nr:hypothetical protein SISNIDRAFT_548556 [Sistotremastrum niveocremeum HHB9708]